MPRNRRRKRRAPRGSTGKNLQRQDHAKPAQPNQSSLGKNPGRIVAGRFERYEGLLPHPEHLARFEAILPGTTDRILKIAENQSSHRHRMENKFLNFNGWGEIIGVVFAGLIVLAGIGVGGFLLYAGKDI